jgi:hypothetical protein
VQNLSLSFVDLSAKTAVPDFQAVVGNNLSVKPGRTIAGNLPVEADGRERSAGREFAKAASFVVDAEFKVFTRGPARRNRRRNLPETLSDGFL